MTRIDLIQRPWIKSMFKSRWPQFILRLIALGGFLLAILSSLVGTPVGSRNFGIIFVWIAWWSLLMLIAVPLMGRGWCSICPIPLPGEWIQQGAVLGPAGRGRGLGRRWPNKLRNIWLQNATFTLVALFSIVVLTQPRVSALVLAVFLFIAIAASLIFERRAFCRYLCPVGGFIGLYSQVAPVELRVVDTAVCAAHTEKSCYVGNDEGFGCPWQVYPGGLTKNTYCGTCMECLRTCPHDNIAINLRAFGDDLLVASGRKMDEAFKSFLMLGSALIYCAVLLGPWGALKSAAYSVGSLSWVVYAMTFLAIVFGLLPALFLLSVIAGGALSGASKSHISQPGSWLKSHRKTYIAFAYALVPLGLAAWVAFSLSFVFTNLSYLWPALSDPLGWGWDLFHTASVNWTPYLSSWLPVMQVIVLLVGLVWASRVAVRIAHQHITSERLPRDVSPTRLALPVVAFCLALTAGLLALLVA